MKKVFKNKKGFALVELLAVIVILSITMVVSTQKVGRVIQDTRADAFVESYQMIAKQVKTYIASDQIEEIKCKDYLKQIIPAPPEDFRDSPMAVNVSQVAMIVYKNILDKVACADKYGLSTDYNLEVSGDANSGFTIILEPRMVPMFDNNGNFVKYDKPEGKFANIDLTASGKAANGTNCEINKIGFGATSCEKQKIEGTITLND